MTPRTVVVVGATSGIGKAVALRLARDGHHILAAGRDPRRAAMGISATRSAPAVTALATEPVTTNGAYYDRTTLTRSSAPSYDTEAAARLWQITERLCGPFDPDTT